MSGQELIDSAQLSGVGPAYIRFRDPNWADPHDYLRLSVLMTGSGKRGIGPWAHLFARRTQEAIGEKTPQVFMTIRGGLFNLEGFLTGSFEPWVGELDPADH